MPTHGSITKAGKVRSQTPKIEGKYDNLNLQVKEIEEIIIRDLFLEEI